MTATVARFDAKVVRTSTCWLWVGAVSDSGYGIFSSRTSESGAAHRFSYEMYVGKIPEGLELDHLCRVRHCVNPWHLEPVTHAENCQRGVDARQGTFAPTLVHRDPAVATLPVTDVDLPDFTRGADDSGGSLSASHAALLSGVDRGDAGTTPAGVSSVAGVA